MQAKIQVGLAACREQEGQQSQFKFPHCQYDSIAQNISNTVFKIFYHYTFSGYNVTPASVSLHMLCLFVCVCVCVCVRACVRACVYTCMLCVSVLAHTYISIM